MNEHVVSRRQLDARASRIAELDESLQQISGALHEEIEKSRQTALVWSDQTDSLRQKLQDVSGERDRLNQQAEAQREAINGRDSELAQLTTRLDEAFRNLESLGAEKAYAQEVFSHEKTALEQQMDSLRGDFSDTESRLRTTAQTLEEHIRELEGQLKSAIQSGEEREVARQHELSERHAEIEALNSDLERLKMDVDAQVKESQELNGAVQRAASDLQSMNDAYRELEDHARNLENLNKAQHESLVSEQNKSRKYLELREREIEALRNKLDASGDGYDDIALLSEEMQSMQVKLAAAEQQLCVMADVQNALQVAEQKLAGHVDVEAGGQHKEIDRLHAELAQFQLQMANRGETQAAFNTLEAENSRLKMELQAVMSLQPALQPGLPESANDTVVMSGGVAELPDAVHSPAVEGSSPVQEQPKFAGRDAFIPALQGVLEADRSMDSEFAVVYLLVDDFKNIREEIGVLHSEHVTGGVYTLLDSLCAGSDMLARFSECTFAMLLSAPDEGGLRQRAEEMRAAVEGKIFECGGRSVLVTASIGVALIGPTDITVDDVVSRANNACETARSCGGNQVLAHTHEKFRAAAPAIIGNEADVVSNVLQGNRLKVYYQSISSLRGDSSHYYEVLARIVDEGYNIITPADFFAMAGRSGLAYDVDCCVIESAVKAMAADKETRTTLFIKLASQTVTNQDLGMWVLKLIKNYKVIPGRLVFQITENDLKQNLKDVSNLTRALHAVGCKVAIEHYALATQVQHLKHIHADYLKIDASLTRNIGSNAENAAKIRSIVDIARSNNYMTIAEKIESPYSLTQLCSLGVDHAQGFFIHEPDVDRRYNFEGIESDGGESQDFGKSVFVIE